MSPNHIIPNLHLGVWSLFIGIRIFSPLLFLLMLFAFSGSKQRRWWLPMIHWSQKLSHICRSRVVAGKTWSGLDQGMAGQPWLLYFKTLFGSVFCDDQVHTLCIPLSTISPLGGEPCSFILYPQSTDHPNLPWATAFFPLRFRYIPKHAISAIYCNIFRYNILRYL